MSVSVTSTPAPVSVTPTPVTLFSHIYPPAPALGSTSAACTYSKKSSDEADRYTRAASSFMEGVVDRAVDEVVVLQGPDWVVTEADYQDYRSAFIDISSDEELEEGKFALLECSL